MFRLFIWLCEKTNPIVMLGDWYIYDIKVVPEQPDWFTDTFWQENTISVYYMNENYDPMMSQVRNICGLKMRRGAERF